MQVLAVGRYFRPCKAPAEIGEAHLGYWYVLCLYTQMQQTCVVDVTVHSSTVRVEVSFWCSMQSQNQRSEPVAYPCY